MRGGHTVRSSDLACTSARVLTNALENFPKFFSFMPAVRFTTNPRHLAKPSELDLHAYPFTMSSATFAIKVVDLLSEALKSIMPGLKSKHDDKQFSSLLAGELVCVRNSLLFISEGLIGDPENHLIQSLLHSLDKMLFQVSQIKRFILRPLGVRIHVGLYAWMKGMTTQHTGLT